MKNRALMSLLAATFALAACALHSEGSANPPWKGLSTDCGNGKKCAIAIHVASCDEKGVTYDYSELHVLSRGEEIVWTIDSPGYEFDKDDGIKFKGAEWPKEFDLPKGNKNKFKWRDKNDLGTGPGRTYTYGVKILRADGSLCYTFDPIIVNDA